ncbi:MAG: efflux RND transporter permease subunit [Candidatus Ozemobacteraceae bacterium]
MMLAEVSIRRPVFTVMVVLALMTFGAISYQSLGIDLFPNVDFPIVTVTCVYRGASPETLETKVIDKIEEELSSLNGIERIESVCGENIAQVYAVFAMEKSIDLAAQDVRDKMAAIRRDLPEAMEPPVIEKLDLGAMPILTVTVAADMSIGKLSRYVKDVVKPRIQSVDGVGSIKEIGLREREIKIWIDNDKLNARHLTVGDVVAAIKSKNIEVPGGKVENDRYEFVVKTMGELPDIEAFRNLTIFVFEGVPVRIGDIATVEDGIRDEKITGRLNGRPTVALQVKKQSGKNTVKIARDVKTIIAALRKEAPAGMQIEIPVDSSPFVEESIHSVLFDLLFGALLATVVILLFLRSFTSTLISAAAIPTSIISTFTVMHALGFTLNTLTTLALSLAVGMLIDDAIVVIENIYRHIELGKSATQASSEAAAEIGLAVLATTLSIVAVFVPVALMQGMVGRFMFQFGITVSVTVLVSLFVSFSLTPMLSSRFLKRHQQTGGISGAIGNALGMLDNGYRSLIGSALRHPFIVLLVAFSALTATVVIGKMIPAEFLPKQDKNAFLVNFRTPPGTSLEGTKRVLTSVEQALGVLGSDAKNLFSTIAADSFEDVTKATINVELIGKNERKSTQFHLMDLARKEVQKVPGMNRFSVEELPDFSGGGISNRPIKYALIGPDFDVLASMTNQLIDWMKSSGGFLDIETSQEPGKPELRLRLARDRMESLGVNLAQLANTVNLLVSGESVITQYKEAGKQFDVKLRLLKTFREYPEELTNLTVRALDGRTGIPLSNIVTMTQDTGAARINRLNRARQISVFASLDGTVGQAAAMKALEEKAKSLMPPGYRGMFQGMSKEMVRSFSNLIFALSLALLMIYMLLASQFNHFIHPFTIMVSVPLAGLGAVIALKAGGYTANVYSMIGIIMLMGLVVKNGILLVEFINQCREGGLSREDAILKAGPIRLRPILMTTACMIGGMIPVALSTGAGSEQRAPMALGVIGGLITSTVLTLVVIPVVYVLFDRALEKLGFKTSHGGDSRIATTSPGKISTGE